MATQRRPRRREAVSEAVGDRRRRRLGAGLGTRQNSSTRAGGATFGGGGGTTALTGAALAGTFFAGVAALLASVLFNCGLLAWNHG